MSNSNDDFHKEQRQKYGAILKKNREDKGISLSEMAKATGLSERMLGKYEEGAYTPNPNKTMMVVYYLGLEKSIDGKVTSGNIKG